MTAATPAQAAYEAYVTFVGLPLSDWPWEADDVNQALWDAVASAVAAAAVRQPQPAPVMHQLSGLVAGWRRYVRSAEEGFPTDREAGHADALREVTRQVTAVIETATAAGPQPAPVDLARVAYEAYAQASGGVSMVSGHPLPTWDDQDEKIRMNWRISTGAVLIADDQAQPAPELDALADAWDTEARVSHGGYADALRSCAADIRKLAGPEK